MKQPPHFPPYTPGRLLLTRLMIVLTLALGFYYLSWRYTSSINWAAWPIAIGLLLAETYSYINAWLFGVTMWRLHRRPAPPPPAQNATVDVFITCYNEPVELVRETAVAARDMSWPHRTYILDDGSSPEMRAMADEIGVGYIVRSEDWRGKARHAKAGNLNNALFQTSGEFILILDADQVPFADLLTHTLGYFRDEKVSFVQTPQWFYNVPPGDPFGSDAPLFYGPIQQGKDGWNAAFFCGSNAVLRREALMQIGLRRYVLELRVRVRRALGAAERMLARAERNLAANADDRARQALRELRSAVGDARRDMRSGVPVQEVTFSFQRRAQSVSRWLVDADFAAIRAELQDIPGVDVGDLDLDFSEVLDDEESVRKVAGRETSPLAAIEAVRGLLLAVDVDRDDEAQPLMPMSTISVTEDMATAMRLHASGWKSVYHDEVLARGLAPEDLRTSLQQRLRWAQGTIQVMLRENPLTVPGLTLGQRLMYFSTMYSYFSGFFSLVFLIAPLLYLFFGILPVRSLSTDFFVHLIPYLVVNQLLFVVIGWGRPTWRGQQYSLALFPLWIQSVLTAFGNVYFGRKLGFVVTPKTRQGGGFQVQLVRWQLLFMVLLTLAAIYGLARVALGLTTETVPILVNVFWVVYDLVMLGVVVWAAAYRQPEEEPAEAGEAPTVQSAEVASGPASVLSVAEERGRVGGGQR